MSGDDRRWLSLTFDEALRGLGRTSPNPLVGCVIVRERAIIGRGFHARAGDEHAEPLALREAGPSARGAVLYVNLEPCCHHRLLEGRFPTCVDQIIGAGIRRVVAAAKDPNPQIDGRGLARLEEAGVEVAPIDPVFDRRARRLNEVFFKFITEKRPFVTLKAGMTLDAKIALPSSASRWITDEAARREGRALRDRVDAVMIGVGTALADDPQLLPDEPAREGASGRRPPARIVLDSRLRLPPGSRLAATAAQAPVLVYGAAAAPPRAEEALRARGVEVIRVGRERVDLAGVLTDLGSREITSVLVEGGGTLHGALLRAGLADKVALFVAPVLLGGRDSVPAFGGPAPENLAAAVRLDGLTLGRAGEALVIEGYPRRPRAGEGAEP